jgi:hypothetical protein
VEVRRAISERSIIDPYRNSEAAERAAAGEQAAASKAKAGLLLDQLAHYAPTR